MDPETAQGFAFPPEPGSGWIMGTALGGLLFALLIFAAPLPAVELNPELRLSPLDPPEADITRRPEEARNITPRNRPRPELDPLGARIRSFMLLTSLDLRLGYNDNLFATQKQTQADFYTVLTPRVELRSGWSRHALRIGADAAQGRYQDFTGENYDDWRVFTDGRLDFGRASTVFGQASVARRHEDRASPDSVGAEPSEYRLTETGGGWSHPFGRFDLRLTANVTDFKFDAVSTAGLPPGTLTGNDRNREARRGEARLRYSIGPGYGVYARTAYTTQNYESLAPDGTDRDSTGYEAGLGADVEITDLIFGNAFVGYYKQSYSAADLADAAGLGFGADVYWNVTRLSTLHLDANRSVQESTQPGVSGYVATQVGIELEHELRRNVLLFLGSRVTRRVYQGQNREEDLYQQRFGANYMLNRHLYLRLQVVHRNQQATGGGRDFTQSFVEQSIVLQY